MVVKPEHPANSAKDLVALSNTPVEKTTARIAELQAENRLPFDDVKPFEPDRRALDSVK